MSGMAEQTHPQESSALPSRRVIDARTEEEAAAKPVNPLTGDELTPADLDRTLHALRGITA